MEKIYEIHPVKMLGEDKEIDTGFTGTISVTIPKYKERMKLVKEQSDAKGDFELVSNKAYDVCEKYTSNYQIKHESEGEIKSIEELGNYREGTAIIFDIYNMVLEGWQLSPKIAKPLEVK